MRNYTISDSDDELIMNPCALNRAVLFVYIYSLDLIRFVLQLTATNSPFIISFVLSFHPTFRKVIFSRSWNTYFLSVTDHFPPSLLHSCVAFSHFLFFFSLASLFCSHLLGIQTSIACSLLYSLYSSSYIHLSTSSSSSPTPSLLFIVIVEFANILHAYRGANSMMLMKRVLATAVVVYFWIVSISKTDD
jgi:hypothetical protein